MAIVTRASKGTALSHNEVDNNFIELRDRPTGQIYPKTSGIGIKIDTDSPTWGWRDLLGRIRYESTDPNSPSFNTYIGNIKATQMALNDEVFVEFHLPHDYTPGSHLYIHAHWSHNSATLSGGGVTWEFEATYAKGFNQAAFSTPIVVSFSQTANTTRYQHMVAETQLSNTGGTGGLLDTDIIEVDAVMLVKIKLSSNTMAPPADPFLHFVDIHYQSTNLATKGKAPNFYV